MAIFQVKLTRETTETSFIEVEALNEEEAEVLAKERVQDDDYFLNWSISDTDLEAEVCL